MRAPALLRRGPGRTALALLGVAAAGACSRTPAEADGPRLLAVGFTPATPREARPWADGLSLRPDPGGRGVWVEAAIERGEWSAVTDAPGLWSTPRPFLHNGAPPGGGAPQRLTVEGEELRPIAPVAARAELERRRRADTEEPTVPGYFAVLDERVYVTWSPGASPGEARFGEYVECARTVDGIARAALGGIEADGMLALTGSRVVLRADVPPGSFLSFATAALAPRPATLSLRVQVDGATVAELEPAARTRPLVEQRRLPIAASGPVEIAFDFDGPPAVGAILCPTIGPDRPEPQEGAAPDVVILLADTFRADNLATYGGNPLGTPRLDALARESVVFESARSSSSWTLPSHTSLFTGLQPHQAGVTTGDDALSLDAVTLAEIFRAAGYRTGAITDDGYVSAVHGLAQGFEWFDGERGSLARTLERTRAFLDADDGRPLFLFVQSYRAHQPYRVSDETRARVGETFEITRAWEDVRGERPPRTKAGRAAALEPPPRMAAAMHDIQALYRGASADLDRGFGELLDLLRARGLLERGYLVFTSDHGEAFWEHGVWEHGNGVWEEHLRIPLLIHGPGLAHRSVAAPAGLVDLPRTLAGLCGIAPPRAWGGRDLLASDPGAVFAFECNLLADPSSLAVVQGDRKLILPMVRTPSGWTYETSPLLAFDLAADPLERRDASREDWPERVLSGLRPALDAALRPRLRGDRASLDAEQLEELQQLGYGGGTAR